mmetsp:Transcript_59069/g.158233  ORF Transcript_59069/g.158233 Transcript_59069/m.158233 type:complete len:216 (-) Transcript_59069:634-1281(-)
MLRGSGIRGCGRRLRGGGRRLQTPGGLCGPALQRRAQREGALPERGDGSEPLLGGLRLHKRTGLPGRGGLLGPRARQAPPLPGAGRRRRAANRGLARSRRRLCQQARALRQAPRPRELLSLGGSGGAGAAAHVLEEHRRRIQKTLPRIRGFSSAHAASPRRHVQAGQQGQGQAHPGLRWSPSTDQLQDRGYAPCGGPWDVGEVPRCKGEDPCEAR